MNFFNKKQKVDLVPIDICEVATLSDEEDPFYRFSNCNSFTVDNTMTYCKLCGRYYDLQYGDCCLVCQEIKKKLNGKKNNKFNFIGLRK